MSKKLDEMLLECNMHGRQLERKNKIASYNQRKALLSGKKAYTDGDNVTYKDSREKYSMYTKELKGYAKFQSLNNKFKNMVEQEKNFQSTLGIGKKLVRDIKRLGTGIKGKKIMADIMAVDEITKQRYDTLEAMQEAMNTDYTEYDADEEFDSLIEAELQKEPPAEANIRTKISKAMGDSK